VAPIRRAQVLNVTRHTLLASSVEVPDHGSSRRKGLLGRDELAQNEGIWIVPCEAVHTFGMRFPIDVVYLNRKRRVVKIRLNVLPGRISACLSAQSVLELPSGTLATSGTTLGDLLEISFTASI
jgi:uncharacterized membrane protein (UPF0127 family)